MNLAIEYTPNESEGSQLQFVNEKDFIQTLSEYAQCDPGPRLETHKIGDEPCLVLFDDFNLFYR